MHTLRPISYFLHFLYVAASLLAATSCVADEDFDLQTGNPEDVVSFQAYISPVNNTRGNHYIPEGIVDDGSFGVLYKAPVQKSSSWSNLQITCEPAMVDFGYEEGPTTGFAYYETEDGKRKDLKWSKVYGKGSSSVPFFIHNVTDKSTYTWDAYGNTMTFKKGADGHYPYYFSPLDKIWGTNDLLCGKVEATNKTGKITVPLNHVLSLLKINIEVFSSDDDFFVDLSRAEVSFGTILSEISMFAPYRHTEFFYGSSSPPQGQQSVPKEVTLVQPEDKTNLCWDGDPVESTVVTEDGTYRKRTYSTKEFVVPPQSIPYNSSAKRPILSVRIPKEDAVGSQGAEGYVTYSGYIPDIMFECDEEGNIIGWTPLTIAFKSGYELEITASINSPNTELSFAPVKVETWVSKGEYNLAPKQAGIYKPEQFYAMAQLYKEGKTDELHRFGYWDGDGNFVAQIWANLNLDINLVRDCMKPENPDQDLPPFYFVFNSFSVNLSDSEGNTTECLTESPGEMQLHNIVSGTEDMQFIGIKSQSDLLKVVDMFQHDTKPTLEEIRRYGTISNGDNIINFKVEKSMDAEIASIFRMLPATYMNKTLQFSVAEGATVDLFLTAAGKTYHYNSKGGSEENYLNKLAVARSPGVGADWEYYMLYEAYNEYAADYEEILSAFGTWNSAHTQLTIPFTASMTLDGEKVYLGMVPDTANGKPNFSASIQSGYSLTVLHQQVPSIFTHTSLSSTTFDYIDMALKGSNPNKLNTSSEISNLVNYYTSCATSRDYARLWRLGRFEGGKWTFNLDFNSTSYSYVSYSSFFGKMVPDESEGRFDYDFNLPINTEIRSVPTDLSGLSSTTMTFKNNGYSTNYPSDASAFKKMADGTYWDYFEEWKKSAKRK